VPDMDENSLPLDEFIKLPTTVDFGSFNSRAFKEYAKDKPYIRIGKELSSGFFVGYTNVAYIQQIFEDVEASHFEFFPKILSPLDQAINTDAGITPVIEHPYLGLSGKGVIIGIVDTGIDYTKEVFTHEDGTTKILSLWDQTLDGPRGPGVYFGGEFSKEKIQEALKAENPFDIVPSMDTDGHGTFLASVAAGRQTADYIGAAPGADLIIVKLRRANQYYIDRFFRPPDEPNLYESSDFLLGVNYIVEKATQLNTPLVLCIGMGSNQGTHDGNSILEDYISFISKIPGYAAVTAAGNESNAKHHTYDVIRRTGATSVVGVRVGDDSTSLCHDYTSLFPR